MVPFRPNAYENFFTDKSLYGIVDSRFNAYVKKYEKVILDEDASVKGEIVNGNQVYDDSVTVTTNSFVTSRLHLNADLNTINTSLQSSIRISVVPLPISLVRRVVLALPHLQVRLQSLQLMLV